MLEMLFFVFLFPNPGRVELNEVRPCCYTVLFFIPHKNLAWNFRGGKGDHFCCLTLTSHIISEIWRGNGSVALD